MVMMYADENFSFPVVEELRLLGDEIIAAHEVGQAHQGIKDFDVLAYATQHGRAVITFNRLHYKRLHRHVRPHHGIIICTQDQDVVSLAQRIHQAIIAHPSLDNQLIRVNRPQQP